MKPYEEFDGAKVNYETLDGRKSTAYLDKQIAENLFSGTNKHTDEKVVVMWIEEDEKYVEWFEHDGEVMTWLRRELFLEYQRTMLQEVYGPAVYGDPENFVVFQTASGDWEMKPAEGYIAAQVRGILNTVDQEAERSE